MHCVMIFTLNICQWHVWIFLVETVSSYKHGDGSVHKEADLQEFLVTLPFFEAHSKPYHIMHKTFFYTCMKIQRSKIASQLCCCLDLRDRHIIFCGTMGSYPKKSIYKLFQKKPQQLCFRLLKKEKKLFATKVTLLQGVFLCLKTHSGLILIQKIHLI